MSASFPGSLSVGHIIDGRFPLLRRLGGSEWSVAYLTELDDGSAKKAAIKIFPFASVDADATLARWHVARTLSHPHLMPLIHAARIDADGEDLLYVVTDYADETLSLILPERPLTPDEAREMLGPLLSALSYLHGRALTHGHLRSTNIMVVDDRVKLSPDFGWHSRAHSVYDPPEAEAGHLTPQADIWSLGFLLVEALTQQPPAWDRARGGEPEVPATIPEPFFTIARECLQLDPARRCTLALIKAHLNPPQTAETAVQPAESTADHSARPTFKLRAMIVTGALLLLLLFIAAFRFGYDLTPSSPLPMLQPSTPASATAEPQSSAPEPSTAPTPATEAPESSAVEESAAH